MEGEGDASAVAVCESREASRKEWVEDIFLRRAAFIRNPNPMFQTIAYSPLSGIEEPRVCFFQGGVGQLGPVDNKCEMRIDDHSNITFPAGARSTVAV
jgi:hypothetical protein